MLDSTSMAGQADGEIDYTQATSRTVTVDAYPVPSRPVPTIFSDLESRVVRLAASSHERPSPRNSLSTVARRISSAVDVLLARNGHQQLADPRLEALRNQAVAVRDGRHAAHPEFLAAGYTSDHVARIADYMQASARRRTPAARRDRAAYVGGMTLAIGSILGFFGLTVSLL